MLTHSTVCVSRIWSTNKLVMANGKHRSWGGWGVVGKGRNEESTDFVAADRLCSELMGIDPKYMKYLEWCGDAGMGNFDLSRIRVNGPNYKRHIIKYKMNKNFDWQVSWIQ